MDAYVFISGADRAAISELRKANDDRLRFITPLTGPYDGFVAIEGAGLRDVQDAILDRIRGAGLRDTDTSIAVRVPPPVDEDTLRAGGGHIPTALRRWFVPRRVEAYVRIRARRGHARTIYDNISNVDGYLGHALVAGRCDLIVGLGGEEFQTVADEVLTQVHEMDGVASTVTSFAINDDGGNAF
jgi:hypothetical protein